MNIDQIINTVKTHGGEIWADGGKLRCRAPDDIITPLLPKLKEFKTEILTALKSSANDEPIRKSPIAIYRVIVDGKAMSVIDPHNTPYKKFEEGIHNRFGKHRVNIIERK